MGGILVHVGDYERLGEEGLDVFAGTAVSVPTRSDFSPEGAIDFVLLRTVNIR